jgi:hypothetical protein
VAQVEILAAMKERRFRDVIKRFGIAVAALLRQPPVVELLATKRKFGFPGISAMAFMQISVTLIYSTQSVAVCT